MPIQRWANLKEFTPASLVEVLAIVESMNAHIYEPTAPTPDVVEQLRELLDKTHLNAVPSLAGQLSKRELVAVADLLYTQPNEKLYKKAVALGVAAKYRALVARSWRLIADGPPEVGLVRIIRAGLADGFHDAISGNEDEHTRIESWFRFNDLPKNLLDDMEAKDITYSDWLRGTPDLEPPIKSESFLCDEMRCNLLAKGSAATLIKHDSLLLSWVIELTQATRAVLPEQFAANYLGKLHTEKAWQDEVVNWVLERFGKPPATRLVDSWRRIDEQSPGVVRAVLSWLAMRELEKFFKKIGDPHGRFRFWRANFESDIAEAKEVAGGQAILFHIPPIAVVEFAQIGNAAYIYPDSELTRLRQSGWHDVGYYKQIDKIIARPSNRDRFRILHQRGWQGRYLNDLKVLVQRNRRRRT